MPLVYTHKALFTNDADDSLFEAIMKSTALHPYLPETRDQYCNVTTSTELWYYARN